MRIVVAGESGTGKSSLILAAVYKKPPNNVPPVLPPSHLSEDSSIIIIDTPSGDEHSDKRAEEFERADVVVLTYACDRPDTFDKLRSYWLPELRRLEVKVPVVFVGCKLDLTVDEQQRAGLEQEMSTIMKQFHEIETYLQCSAHKLTRIPLVFPLALRCLLQPSVGLIDKQTRSLTPQCRNALKRIFLLCDVDMDGFLCDAEFIMFEIKCFNIHSKRSQLNDVKKMLKDKCPAGMNDRGLTIKGFICYHEDFIEKGAFHVIWAILQAFGYNNDIRLVHDSLQHFRRSLDQSAELTDIALKFLRGIFKLYDKDNDGVIHHADLEVLFCTAPDCPFWTESPYMNAVSTTASGGFTLNGFLSQWVLMTLLEPAKSFEYLKYIMYHGDAASAIRFTRKRLIDRRKGQSERNVYQCFVFGPKNAGKTALLDGLLGRPFSDASIPNTEERHAVNVVDGTAGGQKFLVLREIPEAKVKNLLVRRESLAACDLALFVYDSTDESSFKNTAELLAKVARLGERTCYEVPFLIVSAKDDLSSYATSIQDSARLSEDMGINAPVRISAKAGHLSHIFQSIITAAEHPHLGIPKIGADRSREQDHHRDYLSLVISFSAVAALYIVGSSVAARVWARRVG